MPRERDIGLVPVQRRRHQHMGGVDRGTLRFVDGRGVTVGHGVIDLGVIDTVAPLSSRTDSAFVDAVTTVPSEPLSTCTPPTLPVCRNRMRSPTVKPRLAVACAVHCISYRADRYPATRRGY